MRDTEKPAPSLSIIVTSRNDDHGGDPLSRLKAHLRFLARAASIAQIPTEEVIVEWNPPRESARLADLLPLSDFEHEFLTVRIVTVESDVHARIPNSDRLPLFQMIAKNVGIQAARAALVLTTNIDVLIGSEVLRRAAKTALGEVVTATRVDVEGWRPEYLDGVDDNGVQLWPLVTAVNAPLGVAIGLPSFLRALMRRGRVVRSMRFIDAFLTAVFVIAVRNARSWVRSLPRLIGASYEWAGGEDRASALVRLREFNKIVPPISKRARVANLFLIVRARTHACGDFLLMHRDDWRDLRGFPSWPVYPLHLDSILLYQAIVSGRRPRHIRMPNAVWHLNHEVGSGYTTSQPSALIDRLRSQGIPYIDYAGLSLIRAGLVVGPSVRLNVHNPVISS